MRKQGPSRQQCGMICGKWPHILQAHPSCLWSFEQQARLIMCVSSGTTEATSPARGAQFFYAAMAEIQYDTEIARVRHQDRIVRMGQMVRPWRHRQARDKIALRANRKTSQTR